MNRCKHVWRIVDADRDKGELSGKWRTTFSCVCNGCNKPKTFTVKGCFEATDFEDGIFRR